MATRHRLKRVSQSHRIDEAAQVATSKARDKLNAKAHKAKGKAEFAAGDLTGSDSKRAEGHQDALKGIAN
jgi:uncharacterized protein YjbJ (UPF0337 family)